MCVLTTAEVFGEASDFLVGGSAYGARLEHGRLLIHCSPRSGVIDTVVRRRRHEPGVFPQSSSCCVSDHVGKICVGSTLRGPNGFRQAKEVVRCPMVVGIEECDPFGAGTVDAKVPGRTCAPFGCRITRTASPNPEATTLVESVEPSSTTRICNGG